MQEVPAVPGFVGAIKEWITLIVVVAGAVGSTYAWLTRDLKRRIVNPMEAKIGKVSDDLNGLGNRTTALEITAGQHETALDKIDRDSVISQEERKQLFSKASENKGNIDILAQRMAQHQEQIMNAVTDIKVAVGRIDERVKSIQEDRRGHPN